MFYNYYNANGIRTSKTVAGVKYDYILDGTKILREEWCGNILTPIYDNEESVCGIIYNGVPYYFQKNLQGDVIGITNEHGTVVGAYRYDAWGFNTGIITCTELTDGVDIANINPFRYRSYYFDKEIEMYYLQSRHYDPVVGRFVNADVVDVATLKGGKGYGNLFAYCENDAVNQSDAFGNLGINSLLSLIDDALSLIMSIASTAACDSRPYKQLGSQIKSAKTRTARKKLVKAQKKLLKNGVGKDLYRIAQIIGYIVLFAPFVQYLVQWRNDSILFVELVVTIIVEVITIMLCELTSWLIGLIPFAGFILGFAGSWLIGKLLDMHFTDRRISNIASYYNKQLPRLTSLWKWIETFGYALTI
jgi:RHS repeat-associated protein